MFGDNLRRFVLLASFLVALAALAWNLLVVGNDLVWSAFVALCVMFAVGIVLFLAASAVARVLLSFLMEKKREKEREKEAAAAAAAAAAAKKGPNRSAAGSAGS